MRKINAQGMALIKAFEGFRSYPYLDSRGVRTIGYGHTQGVTPYTTPITQEEAEELLSLDLEEAQRAVEAHIAVALGDNRYAALVSLTYNAGTAPLEKTLGRCLNAGEFARAADEFLKWTYAGTTQLPGLVRRRTAERALFLTPETESSSSF